MNTEIQSTEKAEGVAGTWRITVAVSNPRTQAGALCVEARKSPNEMYESSTGMFKVKIPIYTSPFVPLPIQFSTQPTVI